jgi:hypothetical protein
MNGGNVFLVMFFSSSYQYVHLILNDIVRLLIFSTIPTNILFQYFDFHYVGY